MSRLKSIWMPVCLIITAAALPTQSAAQVSQAEVDAKMDEVRSALKGKTVMDVMEQVAAKDPDYNGPIWLYPTNKTFLRKSFLPIYFDSIDQASRLMSANFIFGRGDQTESVSTLDMTKLLINTSKSPLDEPILEEIYGSLSPRMIFTAFDLPVFEQTRVNINWQAGRQKQLTTDTSLSAGYLSIQAKDDMGLWVYSLDMALNADARMITFRTAHGTETYTLDGLTTDAVQAISINGKAVFSIPVEEKPSEKLRREMGL